MPWWKSAWVPPAAMIVPIVLLLRGAMVPGGSYGAVMAAVTGWLLVGIWWVYTGVLRIRARSWWPLLVTPAAFVACWTVASGDLPGRLVFAQHRAQLEQEATRNPGAGRTQVGAYTFESVYRYGGCQFFAVEDPAFATSAGFAWCPGVVPSPTSEGHDFEPLDGDWYVFLVRHELWVNRFKGAHPWGIQVSELHKRTET